MGLYKELKERKNSGEKLELNELTVFELKRLYIDEQKSDYQISELFDVNISKITYRRKKYGITIRNGILDGLLFAKSEETKEMNNEVRGKLLTEENITMISKAITHFAFRNGPIEDMHADPDSQLSDADMKILNKFMVNRIAYIFKLIIEGRWIELDILIRTTDKMYGIDWDEAEPDDGGTRRMIEFMLENDKKKVHQR